MATKYYNTVLGSVDNNGNATVIYPKTKAENVLTSSGLSVEDNLDAIKSLISGVTGYDIDPADIIATANGWTGSGTILLTNDGSILSYSQNNDVVGKYVYITNDISVENAYIQSRMINMTISKGLYKIEALIPYTGGIENNCALHMYPENQYVKKVASLTDNQPFIVEFTLNGNNVTCNRTIGEIAEAIKSHKPVIVYANDNQLFCSDMSITEYSNDGNPWTGFIYFTGFFGGDLPITLEVQQVEYSIYEGAESMTYNRSSIPLS